MLKLTVNPNEGYVSEVDTQFFNFVTRHSHESGYSNIFLTFYGKEIDIYFPEYPDEYDREFRINSTLPFSFKGTTILSIKEDQFRDYEEKREFIEALINNVHYYKN